MRGIDGGAGIAFGSFRRGVHDFPRGGIDHVIRLPGVRTYGLSSNEHFGHGFPLFWVYSHCRGGL